LKAVQITKFGSADVLEVTDLPEPKPGPGQVRVRHKAIGLNFIDTYHRSGLYEVELPFSPGMEAAGVVDAIGEGVSEARLGDRVVYIDRSLGAYAAANIVNEERLIPLPIGVDERLAAGITLKGLTAHYLVTSTFPVKKGHWVLVHAASGATGSIIVQWLAHLGAKIIGTVGSAEKAKAAAAHGAHHVINYEDQDFVEEVRRITDQRGVDVVFDGVGKATNRGSMACLKTRGTMVSFGNASGSPEAIDPLELMSYGSIYFTRPSINHYTLTRDEYLSRAKELFGLVSSGVLRVKLANIYPLEAAAQAHKDLEARRIRGPSILIPDPL
jgi:NADPH2:quinone reductase